MSYTPITEDVRAVYIARGEAITPTTAEKHDQRAESFDRWLTAHDAEVTAGALEEFLNSKEGQASGYTAYLERLIAGYRNDKEPSNGND